MFITPVISGSARVSNDSFGLMPLNALNGSDSTFPMYSDNTVGSNIPPSYEEAVSSVLCGSLAFDTQRESRQPSPSTPRTRKPTDNNLRNFKMSPTPCRVAPETPHNDDVMTNFVHLHGADDSVMSVSQIALEPREKHSCKTNRSSSENTGSPDPPPAYDDVIQMSRGMSRDPTIATVDYSAESGHISIISSSTNGCVLSEMENAQVKSRKRKRMRHMLCGCLVVVLIVAVPILILVMTSTSNNKDKIETTVQPAVSSTSAPIDMDKEDHLMHIQKREVKHIVDQSKLFVLSRG